MRTLLWLGVVALANGQLFAQEVRPDGLESLAAGPAERIWSDQTRNGQELWLRRSVAISKPVKSASLVVSCDDRFKVYVNGKLMAQEIGWQKLVIVDVTEQLRDDDNTIAVHATNEGGSAALALWLTWEESAGGGGEVVTDGDWRRRLHTGLGRGRHIPGPA